VFEETYIAGAETACYGPRILTQRRRNIAPDENPNARSSGTPTRDSETAEPVGVIPGKTAA